MAYSRAAPRVFVGADRMPSSAGWSGHNGQQGAGISQILRVLLHGYPILPSSPLPPSSADSPAAGLRSSAFVPFVMARMLSMFAQQMQAVVVAWQVYDLTRRSEEHTSELQSQSNLVCRLLLEKKKNKTTTETRRQRL